MMYTSRRNLLRLAGAVGVASVLAACGGGDDSGTGGETVSADDVTKALEEGGELLVWSWDTTIAPTAQAFMTKYPKVKINVVNAGTNQDQYVALQNALSAGKGVPDLAHIEYYALSQFSLAKNVADLSGFGASAYKDKFAPGPWNAVSANGGVFGLPLDSGPMVLYYNKEVFDKHGVAVPTTWDEYYEAAKKLHAADPKVYIASDSGDAGTTTSMIWQAGGKPYTVNGTDITINFADAGAQKYTALWQKMIDEKLLSSISGWTDEWFQALGNGTLATLVVGAWMPSNLVSGSPNASGKWRVAPMPQWEKGGTATAENGGSAMSVMEASTRKALAYGFLDYLTAGEGVKTRIDNGAFPATTADLNSPEFQAKEFEYFGGQKINEIFAQSSANVVPGWSYLPYQVYANSIFKDTAGQAYISSTKLADGLKAWQDASVKYGNEQGFTVK
ncbi:ABC transporter substrate-binding protein [Catenuloplanes atrovinosus]|uniref:Multiple sugar transport system substrate-binding protein n=1 Tax=Catenuloplanes atrovinosus TaxID=137266 RepID=A0AAE4C9M1_9ACTN|nr:sugar ABC transporter substrate-binding protein [Catenuloplanes atrovinosus]MDR7276208.1 multiple sugar transport system substrate-binding protein [Catenuloplanes atrovinosus]